MDADDRSKLTLILAAFFYAVEIYRDNDHMQYDVLALDYTKNIAEQLRNMMRQREYMYVFSAIL